MQIFTKSNNNVGDVFFGAEPIDLFKVNEISETVSKEHFCAQVDRYLDSNNGKLSIVCEVSAPPFERFINQLDRSQIARIVIKARHDNNDAVKATLECEILLNKGVIVLTTQWCAYKSMRAEEIVNTLLVPIHKLALHKKTFIPFGDELEALIENDDYETEIRAIFSLAEHPEQYSPKYVDILVNASQCLEKD